MAERNEVLEVDVHSGHNKGASPSIKHKLEQESWPEHGTKQEKEELQGKLNVAEVQHQAALDDVKGRAHRENAHAEEVAEKVKSERERLAERARKY